MRCILSDLTHRTAGLGRRGEHGNLPCWCPSHGLSVWPHCQHDPPLWAAPTEPPHWAPGSRSGQRQRELDRDTADRQTDRQRE